MKHSRFALLSELIQKICFRIAAKEGFFLSVRRQHSAAAPDSTLVLVPALILSSVRLAWVTSDSEPDSELMTTQASRRRQAIFLSKNVLAGHLFLADPLFNPWFRVGHSPAKAKIFESFREQSCA